jgi:hypothetical protein
MPKSPASADPQSEVKAPSAVSSAAPGVPLSARLGNQNMQQLLESRRHEADLKAVARRGQALVIAEHRGELSSAMEALAGSGRAAAMLDIYADVRALKGSRDDLLKAYRRHRVLRPHAPGGYDTSYAHRMDWLNVDFRGDLETDIENRLKTYQLTRGELDKRVARFEAAFRRGMLDLATVSLDRAKEICENELNQPGRLDVTAREIFGRLARVRQPVVAMLERAKGLRWNSYNIAIAEGAGAEFDLEHSSMGLLEESHRVRALGLALATQTLDDIPFFAWPDFPREEIVRAASAQEVSWRLGSYLQKHIDAIEEARNQLDDTRRMYRFDALVSAAIRQFHIPDGSVFLQIIADEQERAGSMSLSDKVIAVLTFALIAASIVVPATAPFAAVALAGIGITGAAQAVEQYSQDRAAFRVGLQSVDPSLFWVAVALIGAALDVQGMLHVLQTEAVLRALREFERTRDLSRLSSDLRQVPKSELSDTAREAIEDAAKRKAAGKPREVPRQQETQQQKMAGRREDETPPDGVASRRRQQEREKRRQEDRKRGRIERGGKIEEHSGTITGETDSGPSKPGGDRPTSKPPHERHDTEPGIHPDLVPEPETPPTAPAAAPRRRSSPASRAGAAAGEAASIGPTSSGMKRAIRYIEADDPSKARLMTVHEGRAYYVSTGTDGKTPGEFYPFYGSEEGGPYRIFDVTDHDDIGHIDVTKGHLIKYKNVEPTGRLEAVPELRNYTYQIEFETSSPQAINAWLRERGVARVYTSLEDYMRKAGVEVQVFR